MKQNGSSPNVVAELTDSSDPDDENEDLGLRAQNSHAGAALRDVDASPTMAPREESSQDRVLCTKTGWKVLILGQSLSFLLASSGAAQATLHLKCNLSAPTFASAFIYLALSFHLIPLYFRGRRMRNASEGIVRDVRSPYWMFRIIPVYAPPWAYVFIALLDVEANYMTVLAFRYTTITSVTLFDALAIPSAMILSRLFLARRYTPVHFLGVLVCMSGIVFNVLADYESEVASKDEQSSGPNEYPHKVWGDGLAIIGGIIYGANDVLAETAVRRFGGPIEFLGMLGFFGFLISVIQAAVLEREDIADFFRGTAKDGACSVGDGLSLLLVYVTGCSLSYIGASRFLTLSEATFLNLSFLTGDFWSVAFSIVSERITPQPLFWVALTSTITGVVIYEIAPSTIVADVKYEIVSHVSTREIELSTSDHSLT